MRRATSAAFFDVDETLIRVKGMFEFLRFWLAVHGDDGREYDAVARRFRAMAESGVHRSHINRAYYGLFAGVPVVEAEQVGAEWYGRYRDEPEAFVTASLDALAAHDRAGEMVVLVSGSFPPILGPIARDLGAGMMLCTEPTVDAHGCYTGEVDVPMIGENKARAVAQAIADLGLRAAECACYADHVSDLDMLRVVGRPAVVGDDPDLRDHAARHGWPVLSGATGPRPAGPGVAGARSRA